MTQQPSLLDRRIGHQRNLPLPQPWNEALFDAAARQVVEHLIGCDRLAARKHDELFHVVGIEIADAPAAYFSGLDQRSKARDGFGKRHAAAPMQQIKIETIGLQPFQAAIVPWRVAFCGSTLLTRKTSSRLPAIASATTSSAAPSPYISAVSISVMPRSSPVCSALISSARRARL